jgi:hypothetical protein
MAVEFEPAMWYDATTQCLTPTCPNLDKIWDINPLYSNAGNDVRVVCGLCSNDMTILTATLLDPQPEVV